MASTGIALLLAYTTIVAAQSWCSPGSNKCGTIDETPTDLSCGTCRSWTFSANIAANEIRMLGLDGGATATDGNADNTYMVSTSLLNSFDLTDGSNWQLTLLDTSVVPNTKGGALWSTSDNKTMFAFGGRVPEPDPVPSGNSLPMLDLSSDEWGNSQNDIAVIRLTDGANVNVPELETAYYIGGYQNQDTSTSAPQDGLAHFAGSMIAFNTSSQTPTTIDAPFLPVQHGAVFYVPVGGGLLVYIGGEQPIATSSTSDPAMNLTTGQFSVNKWDHAWIYDIKAEAWYKQPTVNAPSPLSEFCGAVLYDDDTKSWQIWTIGGVNFKTGVVQDTVSVLSIPSFEWFTADSAATRMSTACVNVGPQIFVIGGRNEYTPSGGSDYDAVAFIYDANKQASTTSFTNTHTSYNAPSTIKSAVGSSSTPSSWANTALQELFVATSTNSAGASSSSSSSSSTVSHNNKTDSGKQGISAGAIAGIVVGVIVLLLITVAAVFFWLRKRQHTRHELDSTSRGVYHNAKLVEAPVEGMRHEMEAKQPAVEIG